MTQAINDGRYLHVPISDLGKAWDRIFQQKSFLNGELNVIGKELETKRRDIEVDDLFISIENLANIKESQINLINELIHLKVADANQQLSEALRLCKQLADLEQNHTQNTILEESRRKRKNKWENFMDEVTFQYSKINIEFKEKQVKTTQSYKELQAKLK